MMITEPRCETKTFRVGKRLCPFKKLTRQFSKGNQYCRIESAAQGWRRARRAASSLISPNARTSPFKGQRCNYIALTAASIREGPIAECCALDPIKSLLELCSRTTSLVVGSRRWTSDIDRIGDIGCIGDSGR
ncbi:hypothetical protein EVAR_49670_1 [Eumeta japonica]|uniref:Uncharacterized protein n=1 Tax=Eumeta variegata TaxID=151549 RepID=A0A4C1WR90_EUMVA|nr:hypothetical protein EVAR_49670_1 [Eumeta japonica]